MPRFHIINFGCRANQSDGARLQEELSRHGFRMAAGGEQAEIVVLNSCTVTAAADYGVRQAARRAHRENPSARILVTGCYAQRRPEELAALAGVTCVIGNSHKTEIAVLLSQECSSAAGTDQFVPLQALLHPATPQSLDHDFQALGSSLPAPGPTPKILRGDIFTHQKFLSSPALEGPSGDRTRPNLKIQDGCNNRCSFCVIPYVRGRSRSLPLADVLNHIRALCQAGYREVVLSGINLGRYGRDLDGGQGGQLRFAELVRAILEETPLERLRLSSVEPMDFTNELLDLMASSSRIAQHFHAPLQSGSDRILRLMRRKYHPHNYRDRIQAAFARMPDAAFGADVMVGFPGETQEDFEHTRSFIDSLPFTYLHIFPFSRRPGTPADKMDGQVNGAVVRERARILRELRAEKNLQFRRKQLGRVLEVITLDKDEPEAVPGGVWSISDNFLDVLIPGERLPANQLIPVRIVALCEEGLVAHIENPTVLAN
ncbi:MAG: tRNA (N(6)-L-threonylcarbamoyladenosine(37)-C(2))-methylthiotransferase MtaB [Acidobacteria bacterium]|nr:tRNA (N(6)-L-threonylcarbamoyladenosine(37)-C(2))-methylthiotransferase MtaB [Acidobacteriota bacterium]